MELEVQKDGQLKQEIVMCGEKKHNLKIIVLRR